MNERLYIRDLFKQYTEIANSDKNQEKISLWKNHYDLIKSSRPMLATTDFNLKYLFIDNPLLCSDEFLREIETKLRSFLFVSTFNDDTVFRPWFKIDAVKACSGITRWGPPVEMGKKSKDDGAAAYVPKLIEEDDFELLKRPYHKIDEIKTQEVYEKYYELAGDIIPFHIDRDPVFKIHDGKYFFGDISTDIGKLIGLENLMLYVYDRPEWLHKILSFMRDCILEVYAQAEKAGDLSSASQGIQGMPYSSRTVAPRLNDYGRKREELFTFSAAQEFTLFSGEMFNEFMFQYQKSILENFGYVAYGCCEDLSNKIKYLKSLKNLRQIAVSPFVKSAEKCAEEIGSDYVLSWRPNPSLVVCNGFDEKTVRNYIRKHLEIFKKEKNITNILIKDIHIFIPGDLVKLNHLIKEEICN